jgi:hypothetical protein
MQGIRYKYKLLIAYMSDTAEYKLCEYINLENNSIKDIRELQRRGSAKPIPNTPSDLGNPKKSYFSLNSTILWTKQERNLRESNLRCVFFRSPSTHIYRCVTGCLSQQMRCYHLKPTRRSEGEAPHERFKSVELALVRPNHPN